MCSFSAGCGNKRCVIGVWGHLNVRAHYTNKSSKLRMEMMVVSSVLYLFQQQVRVEQSVDADQAVGAD